MLSLRDMGYDFVQAVADIVDNSIAARASVVTIEVRYAGEASFIRIADNGHGMNPQGIREALRYGSKTTYREHDLGRFGLGLKTASLSQCRRLTVASRTSETRADITAYAWDIDHIEKNDRWEVLPISRDAMSGILREPLANSPGTVVLWEHIDRVVRYSYAEVARKQLMAMCRELELHLSMVFHRFLAGEVRGKKLKIILNGNTLAPWDPFARGERQTKELEPFELKLDDEGVKGTVRVEPFVLPHQLEFSSPEAFRIAGAGRWNQQQGFYIYRAGRMIQSGGWSGLRTPDEHSKLARVALSFSPELDTAFKINVAKMRVQLPPQLRETLENGTKPVIRIAQDRYRKKDGTPEGTQPRSSGAVASVEMQTHREVHVASSFTATVLSPKSDVTTFDSIASLILNAAQPRERKVVERVVRRARAALQGRE
ncbi:MAG TPA: ATP-binding protein [Thermoanaerobaculia bacterium]